MTDAESRLVDNRQPYITLMSHQASQRFVLEAMDMLRRRAAPELDLDFSPRSLQKLDEYVDRHRADFVVSTIPLDVNVELVVGMGYYLGEVLVRNLGGRWTPPRRFRRFVALMLDSTLHYYGLLAVEVGGMRIEVVRAALSALRDEIPVSFRGIYLDLERRTGNRALSMTSS